jgi:hypothetical protein
MLACWVIARKTGRKTVRKTVRMFRNGPLNNRKLSDAAKVSSSEGRLLAAVRKELDHEYGTAIGLKTKP